MIVRAGGTARKGLVPFPSHVDHCIAKVEWSGRISHFLEYPFNGCSTPRELGEHAGRCLAHGGIVVLLRDTCHDGGDRRSIIGAGLNWRSEVSCPACTRGVGLNQQMTRTRTSCHLILAPPSKKRRELMLRKDGDRVNRPATVAADPESPVAREGASCVRSKDRTTSTDRLPGIPAACPT